MTLIDQSLPERAYYKLLKQLGKKEVSPNVGPVVTWAVSPWTKRKPDQTGWASWCAGAVCTAYLEAGSEQIKKVASLSVQTLYDHLKKEKQTFGEPGDDKTWFVGKGDLVFFGKQGRLSHVGLVEEYKMNLLHVNPPSFQKKLLTLEGNHNNQVAQAERKEWFAFGKIVY